MPGVLPLREVDLARPELFAEGDPHAVWKRLRQEAPIHWNPGNEQLPSFWSVTRYDDVVAISLDTNTFISGKGVMLTPDLPDPSKSPSAGKMLVLTDPPRHTRLRQLVSHGFTPRMVRQTEPHVREIVSGILDKLGSAETFDFAVDVATPLPLAVICELMGVPRADWPYMVELTNRLVGVADEEYRASGVSIVDARKHVNREMFAYFAKLIADLQAQSGQDLISVIVGSEVDGERLSQEELLMFCQLLIVAGNETTRNAASGGMLALLEHPDQWARLQANPAALLPTAVEEILRWTSPVLHMFRTATRDTEIRGQRIHEGERVMMWYPSANRDEAKFSDPDRFDVGRSPNEHLAFGEGRHFCLGASLARLELRVLFEELLRRLPNLALNGRPEYLQSTTLRGIKHLPVHVVSPGAK